MYMRGEIGTLECGTRGIYAYLQTHDSGLFCRNRNMHTFIMRGDLRQRSSEVMRGPSALEPFDRRESHVRATMSCPIMMGTALEQLRVLFPLALRV
jgi:hypothetical protein